MLFQSGNRLIMLLDRRRKMLPGCRIKIYARKISVKNYMSEKVGVLRRWRHRLVRPIIVAHQGRAGSRSWPNPCQIA
jgi:hypothetical protein